MSLLAIIPLVFLLGVITGGVIVYLFLKRHPIAL